MNRLLQFERKIGGQFDVLPSDMTSMQRIDSVETPQYEH